MSFAIRVALLSALVSVVSTQTALAEPITINALDSGWYDASGFSDPTNPNYLAGYTASGPPSNPTLAAEWRNFFVFDLSAIKESILSAELRLTNGRTEGTPNTMSLYDVSTPVSALMTGGSGQVSIFTDLGSGLTYGSAMAAKPLTTFVFNKDGVAALNLAAGGLFAVGGAMALNPLSIFNGVAFDTGLLTDVRELSVTVVPEPSSLLLLGSGLTAALMARRRQRRVSRVDGSEA